LKEWTTTDFRNTTSTTNLKEEEIVDALGNNGNESTPEQVNRTNPWRKMTMMMTMINYIKNMTKNSETLFFEVKIKNMAKA
jgi:hypothetical protein